MKCIVFCIRTIDVTQELLEWMRNNRVIIFQRHTEGVVEVILPDVHAIRMSDNNVY